MKKDQSLEKSVAEQISLLMDDDSGAQSELDAKASGRKIGWLLLSNYNNPHYSLVMKPESVDYANKETVASYLIDLCSGILSSVEQRK